MGKYIYIWDKCLSALAMHDKATKDNYRCSMIASTVTHNKQRWCHSSKRGPVSVTHITHIYNAALLMHVGKECVSMCVLPVFNLQVMEL